jgi:phosphoribosylformylglycinamidine synthase
MKQKYPDGQEVLSPGTVIISAVAEAVDTIRAVSPCLETNLDSHLLYIPFGQGPYALGGSSFAQSLNQLGSDVPDIQDAPYFKKVFNTIQSLIKHDWIYVGHDVGAGGLITSLLEMAFPNPEVGLDITLDGLNGDLAEVLFSEKPAIIVQVHGQGVEDILKKESIAYEHIGQLTEARVCAIAKDDKTIVLDIDDYSDRWFETSARLDREQVNEGFSEKRYKNYRSQPLSYVFPSGFNGEIAPFPEREIKAAILREKGVNSDREMAYALYLAGFDVIDVHMTDLISGRETLEDVHFLVFTGGFSNSDVLGSAKGWAGAFRYNARAKESIKKFYERTDTLSLGVCNGCQLMMELGLIYPEDEAHPRTVMNDSGKFECAFLNITIPENHSILLGKLSGTRLGIWAAHGEGKITLPLHPERYNIAAQYSYSEYPGNPNGSSANIAGMHSRDGRHLAIMPHLERSLFPWNWPFYPSERKQEQITPWMQPFIHAREWLEERQSE